MATVDEIVTSTKSDKSKEAKKLLKAFVVRIDKRLEKYFDMELEDVFGVSGDEKFLSRNIWEHIREHNLRPAKRLRGSFVNAGYKMFGGDDDNAILEAAMSIELIHTALLMHDDLMDQDDIRRGLPTTHEYYKEAHKKKGWRGNGQHYGESMAVNVGDVALLAGHEILLRSNFAIERRVKATQRVLRGIVNTGFGQAYDATLESKGEAKEQDIFDLHLAKTAIYTYENPLHIGATLAGATDEDMEVISKYAISGGVAFQLQDDILGLYGDSEKTGKPDHSDLRQGKMTLLVVKAFEMGNEKQIARLREIWGKSDIDKAEADEARRIVKDTGSLDYSRKISVEWAKKAQVVVPEMKKRGWNKEAIDYLDGIAQYMVEREV